MKIFKYPIPCTGISLPIPAHKFEIEMPKDCYILNFQTKNDYPYLWALIDESQPIIKRNFEIYGTGQELNMPTHELIYHGTVQIDVFVWHLFEVI